MNGDRFREINAWLETELWKAEKEKDYNRIYHFRTAHKHLNLALNHVIRYIEEDKQ